ncbi:hypothetical protein TSOC_003463 [Tetrabaena socialis]|uniref:Uncharacterized protein n=1 Tax=Tetrabaena socialis TaxID=47790 RepID=A0A2J8ABK9_9CHLO|nr:hypothetical protein TSOC_003463 [Tetrabaena socialis]|eukprot:PNH09863.1 hypothetical protein TSOC_003463 [Tetrabaena socialis]
MVWAFSLLLFVSLLPPSLQQSSPVASNSSEAPQYYIHFGQCPPALQKRQFGNWVMTRPKQTSTQSLVLYLNTRNMTAVAKSFGKVEPLDFPIRHIYFAYFNTSGVKEWSPALDRIGYKEVSSFYTITVSGVNGVKKILTTVKDLKDSGVKTPRTSMYSLKGSLNGNIIIPQATVFRIEIVKTCTIISSRFSSSCDQVPDPATVFTSPTGHVVFSLWSVLQRLTVNGVLVHNHAWCPVQTAINTD